LAGFWKCDFLIKKLKKSPTPHGGFCVRKTSLFAKPLLCYTCSMENTNTIPRWNLDSIFSGLDSDEYKKTLADFQTGMDSLDVLLETADKFTREANSNFDFAKWLSQYLKAEDETLSLARTLNAYAYIIYSTDTTSPAYLNNISLIDKMTLRLEQQELKFSMQLLAHQSVLPQFYADYPDFADYKYLLEEILEKTKHKMSPQEENLASDLQRTGGNAWDRLHEQLISNLKDENGKTFNEIRNDAYDENPELRKSAWEKEIKLLSQNRIAFAASLDNLKGETVTLNHRRHYDHALDRTLSSSRLSKKSLDALIESIEDSLPMWREYFKAKAKLLRKTGNTASKSAGTKENPGIAFYDLFAPLSNPSSESSSEKSMLSKKWTFAEARDYVLREYASFSDDMADFAKNAFEKNWIDAEVRPGKVGGAYDEDFPKGHQSRILSNFTGAFSDIITLAHELGHAYHFSCMRGKPVAFMDYPMTLAETASTFAETIVKQDMISNLSGFDKIRMIDLDLQDTSQVLVDILCRFYFERAVFEKREETVLNADDFCRLMREAQEKSYGCGLNEERHEYMWAVKSHYYSTGLDFYNFPYAFGQLFAAGLYARFKKEGRDFAETYKKILASTGNMSCEDLCKNAGFDITTKDFWKSGIAMYEREVELFKSEVDKI